MMHPSVPRKVKYLGKEADVLEYLHKTNCYRIMLSDGKQLVVHRANLEW
jgi:hypothetical protein